MNFLHHINRDIRLLNNLKKIEYLYLKSTEIIYRHQIQEKIFYIKFHPDKLSQNVTFVYRYSCHYLV
jgi:hypothetical protein